MSVCFSNEVETRETRREIFSFLDNFLFFKASLAGSIPSLNIGNSFLAGLSSVELELLVVGAALEHPMLEQAPTTFWGGCSMGGSGDMDMSIWEGELLEAFAALELSTLEQAPTASWDESSMGLSGDRDKLFGRGTEIAGWTDFLALSVMMLPALEQAPTAPWGGSIFRLRSGDKVTEDWAGLQGGTVAPLAPSLSKFLLP